jgi:glycosyltransferase involved in cell wall biosynthesis
MSGLVQQRPAARPLADRVETRWVHCCNGLDPIRDGGMVPSILGMTGALARMGEPITILTPTASRLESTVPPSGVDLLGPETDLERSIRSAEVVHFHGLWQGHTRRGARAARLANVPYLMAAHGMAEPWALRQRALKKKVYTALVEGKNLRRASCLHALSRPEVGHLRAIAPKTPVALIPNGVDLQPFDHLPSRSALKAEYPVLVGKFVVLFFGRLHAKKGLDLLAKGLGSLKHDHPELHVLIAGNDDGALAPFLALAEAAGVSDRITQVGHVSGERAAQVWAAADAFILPSYSEGFSMAILEALACRLPSLITTACHFPELGQAGGGIIVEPTADCVTEGLRELLESSPEEREGIAQQGRALVEARYTWDRQAARLATVYEWVAGGGPTPDAVEDGRI